MEQTAKERACLLAVKHGVALYTRGHGMYGVYADGREVFVCRSHSPTTVWARALLVLSQDQARFRPPTPRFRLTTTSGVFEADTVLGLLVRWCLGRTTLQVQLGDER